MSILQVSNETLRASNLGVESRLKSAAEKEREKEEELKNARVNNDIPNWLVTFRHSGGSL